MYYISCAITRQFDRMVDRMVPILCDKLNLERTEHDVPMK